MAKAISVNPAHRSDPSQRYMMPTFELRVQGKNQNTKTSLENLDAVSAKLRRPSSTIHKFFGLRFNTRLDGNEAGKFFLRGTYKHKDLQTALDDYIVAYVLCGACGNPETTLIIDAKKAPGSIIRDCGACGNRSEVKGDEKMKNVLVKENAVKIIGGEKKKKKKKTPTSTSGASEDDGVAWSADISKEAKEKRRAELLGKTAAQELEDLFKKLEISPEPYLAIKTKESWSEIAWGEKLASTAFNDKIYSQLDSLKPLLLKLCATPDAKLGIINGISILATKTFPHLVKSISAIFQKIFTLDLVDEDIFLKWGKIDDAGTVEARTAATPFLEWLAHAEDEEE